MGAVELARTVLAEGIWDSRGKLRGMDAFTASAVVQVADALSEENAAKLNSITTGVDIVWRLIRKAEA